MNSKAFIFLFLLFSVVLLISSTVAEETSKDEKKTEGETDQIGGRRCKNGCCGGYRKYGGCSKCCSDANEAQAFAAQTKSMPEKEDEVKETDHYGGHCYYGCCGGWGRYGCMKCCKNAAEAADHETNQEIDDANKESGGYGGGHGRGGGGHGGGRGGGGHRGGHCPGCSDAKEAGSTEKETNQEIDDANNDGGGSYRGGGGYGGGHGHGGGGGYGGGHGHGGGGYGGGRGRGGGGHRGGHCPGCSDAEEAGSTDKEAKP